METYGVSESAAHYCLDGSRRDLSKPYKPRKRVKKDKRFYAKLYVDIKVDEDAPYGYRVFQKGKEKAIFTNTGTRYKDGRVKKYPAVGLYDKDKKRNYISSLASLVYILVMDNDEIPTDMVVDHIDNDSFNNNPENLQLLKIIDNVKKNPPRKWNKENKNDCKDI